MKRRIFPTALLALGLFVGSASTAQAHEGREDHGARMAKHMEEAAQRLGLTDAQKQQLRPIVDEHVAKAKAIRDKYPAGASHEQRREMFKEMHAVRENYDTQVRAMLDEKQQQEWDRMRAERRERKREHGKEPHQEPESR